MRYFISVGSNIQPEYNLQRVFPELWQLSPTLHVSRIVQTAPVGVPGGEPFLNLTVSLSSSLSPTELKETFNQIESSLGRDRTDERRKYKSRPMDLDILFWLTAGETAVTTTQLPPEPYIRPMLLELLTWLHISHPEPTPTLPPGVPLRINGRLIGAHPTTIHHHHPAYTPSLREVYVP